MVFESVNRRRQGKAGQLEIAKALGWRGCLQYRQAQLGFSLPQVPQYLARNLSRHERLAHNQRPGHVADERRLALPAPARGIKRSRPEMALLDPELVALYRAGVVSTIRPYDLAIGDRARFLHQGFGMKALGVLPFGPTEIHP